MAVLHQWLFMFKYLFPAFSLLLNVAAYHHLMPLFSSPVTTTLPFPIFQLSPRLKTIPIALAPCDLQPAKDINGPREKKKKKDREKTVETDSCVVMETCFNLAIIGAERLPPANMRQVNVVKFRFQAKEAISKKKQNGVTA